MALQIIETTLDQYMNLVNNNLVENNTIYLCITNRLNKNNILYVNGICYGEYDDTEINNQITILTNSIENIISDRNYKHKQLQSNDTWNINHNLNKMPSVAIVDSGGNVIIGEITYIDLNNLVVKFNSPFSGSAYLN